MSVEVGDDIPTAPAGFVDSIYIYWFVPLAVVLTVHELTPSVRLVTYHFGVVPNEWLMALLVTPSPVYVTTSNPDSTDFFHCQATYVLPDAFNLVAVEDPAVTVNPIELNVVRLPNVVSIVDALVAFVDNSAPTPLTESNK
jgi:hypothetical protein